MNGRSADEPAQGAPADTVRAGAAPTDAQRAGAARGGVPQAGDASPGIAGADAPQTAADVRAALVRLADPDAVPTLQRYFKTGPGEYGEGDVFLGLRVPQVRGVARRFPTLPPEEVSALLAGSVHEERLAGLVILVAQFQRASAPRTRDERARERLAGFYLGQVRAGTVNNWDLVDASAEYILGEYLLDRDRGVVFELAASPVLWHRRVAVLTTFGFLKHGDASTTLEVSRLLLEDPEDLIQKAVGWMLRESGKRVDEAVLLGFLDENAGQMPRTMLAYATERLSPEARARYRAMPRR